MTNWKRALERCPVKSTGYPYAELIHADDQPKIEGIQGDITEILITREIKGYSILLTVLVNDLEEVSEEQITKRLRALGADPDEGWE